MNRNEKVLASIGVILAFPLTATSWFFAGYALWSNNFTLMLVLILAPFVGLGVIYGLYRLVTPATGVGDAPEERSPED